MEKITVRFMKIGKRLCVSSDRSEAYLQMKYLVWLVNTIAACIILKRVDHCFGNLLSRNGPIFFQAGYLSCQPHHG